MSQAICTRRSAGSFSPPYSILLQTGFARHDSHLSSGGLLPHPFTLTRCGNRAVCSLLHFPVACANWTLSSVLPCGARTFLSRSRGSDYQNHSDIKYIIYCPARHPSISSYRIFLQFSFRLANVKSKRLLWVLILFIRPTQKHIPALYELYPLVFANHRAVFTARVLRENFSPDGKTIFPTRIL